MYDVPAASQTEALTMSSFGTVSLRFMRFMRFMQSFPRSSRFYVASRHIIMSTKRITANKGM